VTVVVPHVFATAYEMVVVPEPIAVTFPLWSIVATAELLLLHVPPVVASANVVVTPTPIEKVPVMAATVGKLFTVMVMPVEVAVAVAGVTQALLVKAHVMTSPFARVVVV